MTAWAVPSSSNLSKISRTTGLDLLVGVQRQAAGRRLDVADRRVDDQLAAAGLVEFAADQAAADRMQLQFRDLALQAEHEPVVGVGRVVDAVLVGQQGAEEAADLQELVPVLAGPREAAHLQAQDQPDVVHADLGQQALEAEPGVGGASRSARGPRR